MLFEQQLRQNEYVEKSHYRYTKNIKDYPFRIVYSHEDDGWESSITFEYRKTKVMVIMKQCISHSVADTETTFMEIYNKLCWETINHASSW